MTFEERVKNMSSKEIIMSMVEGLQNPTTKIKMSTYGEVYNNVCYGCAATNTICKIGGYTVEDLLGVNGKPINLMEKLNESKEFVNWFEDAIDSLRTGKIWYYNTIAERYNFAQIEKGWGDNNDIFNNHNYRLTNNYTTKDLIPYIELANKQ